MNDENRQEQNPLGNSSDRPAMGAGSSVMQPLTKEQEAARAELRSLGRTAKDGRVVLLADDYDRLLELTPSWLRFAKTELIDRGVEHFQYGLSPYANVYMRGSDVDASR